jgi:LuxR family quorum-sensing transcriptional regulator LasR
MKSYEQFTELTRCDSVESWRSLIFRIGRGLGFDQTLLAILPDPASPVEAEYAFIHSNYSSCWRSKYDAQNMQHIDPTFTHCMTKSIPLIWSPEIFSGRKQNEMYEEACGHGLRSGITLPIHGPHGEMGTLCFVSDRQAGRQFHRDASSYIPELTCFRDFIFETSCSYMKTPKSKREVPSLTRCELECLKWCAVGKSSWDIAKILNVSEAAINFHFSNLRRKFMVTTRQQVVVKAIRCGIISP